VAFTGLPGMAAGEETIDWRSFGGTEFDTFRLGRIRVFRMGIKSTGKEAKEQQLLDPDCATGGSVLSFLHLSQSDCPCFPSSLLVTSFYKTFGELRGIASLGVVLWVYQCEPGEALMVGKGSR
jgi:hypothetical protein